MGRDRSLDEFLTGAEADADRPASDDAADGATEAAADDGSRDPVRVDEAGIDAPGVAPMAETFAWSAAGGACAGCGERAEVRWRDGGALVCGACKTW